MKKDKDNIELDAVEDHGGIMTIRGGFWTSLLRMALCLILCGFLKVRPFPLLPNMI